MRSHIGSRCEMRSLFVSTHCIAGFIWIPSVSIICMVFISTKLFFSFIWILSLATNISFILVENIIAKILLNVCLSLFQEWLSFKRFSFIHHSLKWISSIVSFIILFIPCCACCGYLLISYLWSWTQCS